MMLWPLNAYPPESLHCIRGKVDGLCFEKFYHILTDVLVYVIRMHTLKVRFCNISHQSLQTSTQVAQSARGYANSSPGLGPRHK